jgi:hypothetical protein
MSGAMAAASLALAAVGTAMTVAGKAQEASAQAGQANYQAQVARNNQMVAEWNAQRALQQGRVDEQNQRSKTASLLGSQRAVLASQGGDVDSGSPLDIQADTARAGEYDAQTIRNNAAVKAYGYRVQGANTGAEANLDDYKAASTMAALPYGIGSSLLGGLSSMSKSSLFNTSPSTPTIRGTGPSGYSGTVWGQGGDYGSSV